MVNLKKGQRYGKKHKPSKYSKKHVGEFTTEQIMRSKPASPHKRKGRSTTKWSKS